MAASVADVGPGAEPIGLPVGHPSLKRQLRRSLRARKLRALMLVLPLLAFVLITFLMPIGEMLFRSVENQIVPDTLPRTVVAIQEWDPATGDPPDEPVYAAFYEDLLEAVRARAHTRLGSRLNYENAGASGLFRKTGRDVTDMDPALPLKEQFIASDRGWGRTGIWETIKLFSGNYTSGYLLNAVDLQRTADGVAAKSENERIYIRLFWRTLVMSLSITLLCALLGYPVAYLLASLPARTSNLLMILVLLPFWTSLLVRTASWKVLLQQQGVINDLLVWSGLIADSGRFVMINNATGTIVAMTHILLPFMILPLYSVMRGISPTYVRAAKSLGANDWTAFWKVYFPQSVPGLGAGGILVFILSIGYYITPELVGGTSGIFISNRIAFHISSSLNWGLAAALATLLLVVVLALYWAYDRVVGVDNVKLG